MSKLNMPSTKERKEARKLEQITLLLSLDLEPTIALTDEEKAVKVAEVLDYWSEPPHVNTLQDWRRDELYADTRDSLLSNDQMVSKLQYWAQREFLKKVLPGYQEILKKPATHKNLWWKVAERIEQLAGIATPKQDVSITVLQFLQAELGDDGLAQQARPLITVEKGPDGTVIDAQFRTLPAAVANALHPESASD